ncbi:MAG: radical SAM protein, partial [Treponema sp.]|nr:radical SAM protein [Treponema sp.]
TPLFKGLIDSVSISLNSSDPKIYEKNCRPKFGQESHGAMLEFAKNAAKFVPNVTMTTVSTTITHDDEKTCRALCQKLGVKYRIRDFI